MANWIIHMITAKGEEGELLALQKSMEGEDGQVIDFNSILPPPEGLEGMHLPNRGYACIQAYALLTGDEDYLNGIMGFLPRYFPSCSEKKLEISLKEMVKLKDKWLQEHGVSEVTATAFAEAKKTVDFLHDPVDFIDYAAFGEVFLDNYDRFGATDLLEWRIDHWGTSYNAVNPYIYEPMTENCGKYSITFLLKTPYGMPKGIYRCLSLRYPEISFSGIWQDCFDYYNRGEWWIKNGHLLCCAEHPDPKDDPCFEESDEEDSESLDGLVFFDGNEYT